MNEDVLTLYRANCRTPEVNLGDIRAMLAALQIGERRVGPDPKATRSHAAVLVH